MLLPALFRRKGPWLFAAAVCLFIGGNALLDGRYQAQNKALNKELRTVQPLGANDVSHVHINALPNGNNSNSMELEVRFDAHATQASVSMDQKQVALQSEVSLDTLRLTVTANGRRGYVGSGAWVLTLPSSIRTLTLDGVGDVTVRDVSLPSKRSDLTLILAGCESSASVASISVGVLHLKRVCSDAAKMSEYGSGVFHLGKETVVSTFIAEVTAGYITLSDEAQVGAAHLRLGNAVTISAPAQLLRRAIWEHP